MGEFCVDITGKENKPLIAFYRMCTTQEEFDAVKTIPGVVIAHDISSLYQLSVPYAVITWESRTLPSGRLQAVIVGDTFLPQSQYDRYRPALSEAAKSASLILSRAQDPENSQWKGAIGALATERICHDPEGKSKVLNLLSQGTLAADGQAYLETTVDIVVKEFKEKHHELESLTVEVIPPSKRLTELAVFTALFLESGTEEV